MASFKGGVALALLPWLLAAAPATRPTIEQRIETVRQKAERLRIDGRADDWAGIPFYTDPAGDGGKKPALDLLRTAIAPREHDLLIVLHTSARPIALGSTYAFEIDVTGSPEPELQIALGKPGTGSAIVYESGKEPTPRPVKDLQAAIANVVEVRIPYASILELLPAETAEAWRKRPRPWVRVSPVSVDVFSRNFADFGASAACYRLTQPPPEPDPSAPASDQAPLRLPLPVAGQWVLWQGPFGSLTHQDQWAYDLVTVDNTFRMSKVPQSSRNEDYYTWDRPVTLPLAGRVIRAIADAEDQAPPKQSPKDTPVNEVYLQVSPETALALSHFRKGTVTASTGEQLAVGKPVGRVGNSGYSSSPHLHLAAWRMPAGEKTVPMVFTRVRVGLNPVADDYWSRELEEWSPVEGMVVQPWP